MDTPVKPQKTIADLIREKLAQARNQLIERNLRNKLVNCALTSKRSKQVRVVDEITDEVFKTLLVSKREMTFAPGRGVESEDAADGDDPDYAVWVPPETSTIDKDGIAKRHRDTVLQTQLTPEGLQKRLTSLHYESIEIEEEQGVNVLYLALGFIKWFEDARSEVARFAPLVLVPVELTRKGARDRFHLKARDEDLHTNVSFKIWLAEQHSIELPDLPDSDEWLPGDYFAQAREAISRAARWEVLDAEILLGFFSFNKFLLWRDLDPDNWPNAELLLNHGILRTLLAPHEEVGSSEPPLIPEDSRLDDRFKAADQVSILDTDSSQTVAIQTALAGRNLVIQGPPGTGKSQTIANIIAAAIHQGKSVLFVAEKLAALQVVYDRLCKVNLAPLCFELHSRRASKQQVLAQLREAINAASPPEIPKNLCDELDAVTAMLWAHSDRLHGSHQPWLQTPYQVIGKICRLRDQGIAVPDFKVADVETWSSARISEFLDEVGKGTQRLLISGVPARHPWRDSGRRPLNPLDAQRLGDLTGKLAATFDALFVILRSVWPLVRVEELEDYRSLGFSELPQVATALELAAVKPNESIDLLCHPRWKTDLDKLDAVIDIAKRLADVEQRLQPIFTDAAWDHDWTAERTEIAGSGESWLRFLRGPYRNAIRTLRGACRTVLPKAYQERVAVVDKLIAGRELRLTLKQAGESFASDLGSLWQALPTGWPRLAKLSAWLHATAALEPRFTVRNAKLLSWTDAPDKWRDRLNRITQTAAEHLRAVVSFVQLDGPLAAEDMRSVTIGLGEIFDRAEGWKSGVERFNEWPPAKEHLDGLRETAGHAFYRRVYDGKIPPSELHGRLHLAICEQIWNRMCETDAQLARLDGRMLDTLVKHFRELDESRICVAASQVARHHFDHRPTGSAGEMAVIRAEINKIRKLLPVRKLLDLAGNAIQVLKPAFLMSPLSVAQYLAPGHLKFDLLLIDEASQIRPEDALGAVARAGQIVVVGDPKQLPPTNFFSRLVSDGDGDPEAESANDGTPAIGSMESILSLCDATLSDRTMLRWHYRSHHPALIAVSNHSFYDNKLLLPPSVTLGAAADGLGLVFHKTPPGSYDRGKSATNVVEADLVAEAVCRFAREYPDKSLGVGAFSVAQRDVIRDRIEARRREAPELEPFFANSRSSPFFVKNLESIQGDERDVIFISIGYGRDQNGRLPASFGPINNSGGERRLNVLISRAKERCEVFSPITAEDVDISSRKAGVVALKQFLQFAEKGYLDVPQRLDKAFDSDFEESVATFLTQRGFKVHPQVGMAGFYIDLGVLSAGNDSRYLLGIECDGATYHSSRSARDRDRIRQSILESRGWQIHRIWSTDWFHRRSAEENRLLDALARAQRPAPVVSERRPRVAAPLLGGATGAVEVKIDIAPKRFPYTEAAFRVSTQAAPHEAPASNVEEAIRRIVEIEGPIHEEEIARRVASVWQLERAGARIQEATQRGLNALRKTGELKPDGPFWSLALGGTAQARDRSATKSTTLRKAEYLPPSEVGLAAVEAVKENVRLPVDQLVVEVARRLGFQRTGQDLQQVIAKVIDAELGKTIQSLEDGSIMLTASH